MFLLVEVKTNSRQKLSCYIEEGLLRFNGTAAKSCRTNRERGVNGVRYQLFYRENA